jgi:hypothetical protein
MNGLENADIRVIVKVLYKATLRTGPSLEASRAGVPITPLDLNMAGGSGSFKQGAAMPSTRETRHG